MPAFRAGVFISSAVYHGSQRDSFLRHWFLFNDILEKLLGELGVKGFQPLVDPGNF
jgi:hypothetical protein